MAPRRIPAATLLALGLLAAAPPTAASATSDPVAPAAADRVTARIPAGALPVLREARRLLRAVASRPSTAAAERAAIGWVLRLDARFTAARAPAGRRATIDLAVRANAWWFSRRPEPGQGSVLRAPGGVLLTWWPGLGFVVNPVATTGRWRGLNADIPSDRLAEALLPLAVARRAVGRRFLAWEYFDVPGSPGAMRPGVSGMAQGRLASLLGHAYHRTGDPRFAAAAAATLAGLTVPVPRGGALSRVSLPGWRHPRPWYVERAYPGDDPWRGAALNGFMVALLALRSTSVQLERVPLGGRRAPQALRASALARSLADHGAATLRVALPAHDLGDWSIYGLRTLGPRRADLNYHCYHVVLLRQLATAYPALGFRTVAARWQGYVGRRGLTCPRR